MKSTNKKSAKAPATKGPRTTTSRSTKPAKTKTAEEQPTALAAVPAVDATEDEDGDVEAMDRELLEFVRAIDEYKRLNRRQFPTWGEVLRVVRTLGYKRSA